MNKQYKIAVFSEYGAGNMSDMRLRDWSSHHRLSYTAKASEVAEPRAILMTPKYNALDAKSKYRMLQLDDKNFS